MFPRSTVQLAVLCVTLFSSFIWFFTGRVGSSSGRGLSTGYLKNARQPPTPPCSVRANVEVHEPADDPIWDIQNSTLGFQKIYAISMPHRTDKRDYLSLMGLVSDLDIEFVDGVNGSTMHPKTLPYFWKGEEEIGTYGVWRAHLNVYQKMVRERIQSALILEDDADWDVLVKAQMTEFARGTRHLQDATLPLHSPYGDDWDLLAIGHIGTNNRPNKDQKYWITRDDPTVIHPSRRTWWRMPDLSAPQLKGDHVRVVHEVKKFTGAQAYGLSLRGAARMLFDQTMLPNAQAIDVAMLVLCRDEAWGSPFCLGAYPMIFGRYRAAGPQDKDSDRRSSTNEAQPGTIKQGHGERVDAESEFTVFPVSLNVELLLKNKYVIPAQQRDVDLINDVDLKQFVMPKGQPVFVKSSEYTDKTKEQEKARTEPLEEKEKQEKASRHRRHVH